MTTDIQTPAPGAGDEIVQTEVETTEAPEAAESTTGQVETPPAEADAPEKTDEQKAEEISASKARRERRKAALAEQRDRMETAEAEASRLRAERDELKALLNNPPPRIEDFEDHDEYLAARTAYQSMRTLDERQVQRLEAQEAETQKTLDDLNRQREAQARENWASQRAEAQKRYADFDKVISAPDLPVTSEMASHLAMMENGADVAYHLGMNKDRAAQLARMNGQQLAGAMQVLGDFVQVSTPQPKTQSSAPDPISPVAPKGAGETDPSKMSPDDYRKWRQSGGTF